MQPISNLTLYNCKLDHTGQKTIDFSSGSVRDSYFSSNNAIATIYSTPFVSNAYFIRENKTIKVGINADVLDANGINYCRFNNPQSGTSQFFYCFIDDIEYSAPQTSILHIHTDVWLTNFDKITPDYCFVEREHVDNDDLYIHTLPEPVPTNIYKNDTVYSEEFLTSDITYFDNNFKVGVYTSEQISALTPFNPDHYIGGVSSPGYLYAVDRVNLSAFIKDISTAQSSDIIVYLIPLINSKVNYHALSGLSYTVYEVSDGGSQNITKYNYIPYTDYIGNHRIRNNKLNTYPYKYILLSDNGQQNVPLKYELCNYDSNGAINFEMRYTVSQNPTLNLYPNLYDNKKNNLNNGVSINDFPMIPYTTNYFSDYMALNKNSVATSYFINRANDIIGSAQSLSSGNVSGAIAGVYNAVTDTIQRNATFKDMQNKPDTINNVPTGNAKGYCENCKLSIYDTHISEEYAEIIDGFFDMFGYNVSTLKLPQWNSRQHYNYIKTNGINIYGAIAKNDKTQIETLINNGLTVWHISSGGTYGLYDSNSIV